MRNQTKTLPLIVGVLSILLGVWHNYSELPESKTGSESSKSSGIQVNGGDQNVNINVNPSTNFSSSNGSKSNPVQNGFNDSPVKRDNSQSNQEEYQKSSSTSASNSVQGTAQNTLRQEASLHSTVKSDRALPQLVAQAAPSTDNASTNNAQSPREGVSMSIGNGSNGNSLVVGPNNTIINQVKSEQNRNIGQVNGPYVENGAICGGSSPICGGSGSTFNFAPNSTPPQR